MDITPVQLDVLRQLESSQTSISHRFDQTRGVVAFVRGENLLVNVPGAAGGVTDQGAALRSFLGRYAGLFGPDDLSQTLRPLRERTDSLGFTHHEFQQVVRIPGPEEQVRVVEVYGAKLAAHFSPASELVEVQSSCHTELSASNRVEVSIEQLRKDTRTLIVQAPGFRQLEERMKKLEDRLFPLAQQPRLVLYPWKDSMLFAWATYGYGPATTDDEFRPHAGAKGGGNGIVFGQMFFDAQSGEMFLFAPTRKGAETPDSGSGSGCIPLGGPYDSRGLQIVRVDGGSTYTLKNKTRARDIITFDADADSSWVYPNIPSLITSGTIPVSSDTDGDKTWNRLAATTSDADRTSSQQPETDAHATVSDLYDWYAALGGRVGWDDDQYSAPLVPDQTLNVVTHTYDDSVGTSRSVNAFFDQELVGGQWVSHLAFFDGDPTGATDPTFVFDYLAGSTAIIGHEYQHAVTDFSFVDGAGNPGLTYSDWLAAVHEGTSDVFGGLYSGNWWMGNDVSPTGQIFRNLAFPRDTAAGDPSKFDHWDDRNNITGSGARYFRGDILAHAAYLMAQGGVHQRASRTPALIPVHGLGRQTVNGRDVYEAARIWYRAMTHYVSNIGAATGLPTNDESVFRTIRDGCVSAAVDLFGAGSVEHKTTILAWYAVGLQPAGTSYGPDVTFVTWGADWWMSRPYVGIPSPDWSSRDLFINNGGTSEWNAKINVLDGGVPTQFENDVYCRVRNVGDQTAHNVQVQFEYTKITAGGATWLPMTDKDGNIQVLNLGDLTAGASNFADSAQDSPPASARVKWWIPPLETGETVDHFCIRATVFSINDVNTTNNTVQSNVAYVPYVPGSGARMGFMIGNDFAERLSVDLRIDHTLPGGWDFQLIEAVRGRVLAPGESRRVHAELRIPQDEKAILQAPFDGRFRGYLGEGKTGCSGVLTAGALRAKILTAQLALLIDEGGHLAGTFTGRLDPAGWQIDGEVRGRLQATNGKTSKPGTWRVAGCLRPDRMINISQYRNDQPIAGLSIQVQVPVPAGSCFEKIPPTDTVVAVEPKHHGQTDRDCLNPAIELVECLNLRDAKVRSVDLRSVLVEITFAKRDCD